MTERILSPQLLKLVQAAGPGYSQANPEWVKKFAELIVRECIGCCEQVISDPVPESVDTWLNGGEQCIQEIKEHFGIEE